MKKINLLAVILFFTMTAGADDSANLKQQYASYITHKACAARNNFSTCIENSTNAKEMSSCESNYHKTLVKIKVLIEGYLMKKELIIKWAIQKLYLNIRCLPLLFFQAICLFSLIMVQFKLTLLAMK